jgi:predicted enzyme involved in methoxymalonyl-ACP biosynthesis
MDRSQLIKLAKLSAKHFRGQITPFAGTLPARSSEQLVCRYGCARTRTNAARHSIVLEITQHSYDQVAQDVLTPDSTVNRSQPDAVLLAPYC